MDDDYEWHHDKNRSNIEKHGYDFGDVALIVEADHLRQDARTKSGEPREMWIGSLRGHVVTAIVTRRPGVIRIISLRRAAHDERRAYHEVFGDPPPGQGGKGGQSE